MHVLVIIAEYNPFHEGHLYHLKQAKEETGASHVLVLMGGNFLQRGDVAIQDKFKRARRALEGGADLVAELPFIYASSWAREFAQGGVRIFQSLPMEATLSFGSETGDLEELISMLDSIPNHKRAPKESYGSFVRKNLVHSSPKGANDVLGLEYLRAWRKGGSNKHLHTLKRLGQAYHDDREHSFPSATSLRKKIKEGKQSLANPLFLEDFQEMIYGAVLTRDMSSTYGAIEGIQHRLLSLLTPRISIHEYVEACSTKRYRPATIRRLLLHHLLHYTKEDHNKLQGTVYLRPLAYTKKGTEVLRALKQADYPLVSSLQYPPEDEKIRASLVFDIKASKLYQFKAGGDWEEYKRNLLYDTRGNKE